MARKKKATVTVVNLTSPTHVRKQLAELKVGEVLELKNFRSKGIAKELRSGGVNLPVPVGHVRHFTFGEAHFSWTNITYVQGQKHGLTAERTIKRTG